jgi:hypothetical protein
MNKRTGRHVPRSENPARIPHYLLAAPAFLAALLAGQNTLLARTPANLSASRAAAAAFYCTNPQRTSTVQGNPQITSVPALESVFLAPKSGGLSVSFKFRTPLVLAPEGVSISWTVYVYRHRSDASNFERNIELQFQDRGKGWEPTGWTIVASTYTAQTLVGGDVQTSKARNQLTAFFPGGFVDLSLPFFWFASQEEFRAYLPEANQAAPQNWSINGEIYTDCPAGVRHDPNSAPYAAKLLTAAR